MPRLPALDIALNVNHSPHVVILGAGASVASCPRGDADGRKLPLMKDLVSVLGLRSLLTKAGFTVRAGENFELIYDRIASDGRFRELQLGIDNAVRQYFASLRIPDEVTLYDQLLLSLRPKDLVASFNWDPLLLQAYARNRHMRLPGIVFLHGNVYLGFCPKDKTKGYLTQTCNTCGQPFQQSPLLFPISKKEYRSHPLLASEWDVLSFTLEHAYMLTIIGYAAPNSDAAAKEILLRAWDGNQTRELASVEVVDILRRRLLYGRWEQFIARQHWAACNRFGMTRQFMYPRRSCETLAFATLQQDPWASKPIPRFRRLDHLQNWIHPLLDEEDAVEKQGAPLPRFTGAR